MAVEKRDFRTIPEYVAFETSVELKHEYDRGDILAMSGGTINHGIICGNIYNELRSGLNNNQTTCKVIGSEVRIHVAAAESIVYPDCMIVCDDIEVSEEDEQAIINPVVIVEVLSKSTGDYDRGDKFYKYRQLPSLKEYVLIDQDKPVIESYFKKDDNIWEISRVTGLGKEIPIKSLGIEIGSRGVSGCGLVIF